MNDLDIKEINDKIKEESAFIDLLMMEMNKVIIGQSHMIERLLIGLLGNGHVLLEGVPGLAKTLAINTLSKAINGKFSRIQFTPDLLPSDVIGTNVYNMPKNEFSIKKGPIFGNFILADEINRAPPKVQSALLEAMQERQVSIHGDTFEIEKPFLVLATQNPIESEGTYRLPEAQIDRFALKLIINYPSKDHEKLIIQRNTQENKPTAKNIVSKDVVLEIQKFVQKIYADEKIEEYVSAIVDATRNPKNYDLELEDMIEFGASPRASIWLILAAKAHALLAGRGFVIPDDIKSIAHDVLRHRIILTFEAEAEGNTSDAIIDKILEKVRAP